MKKTNSPMNYRHQLFTIFTSDSYRYGNREVSATDFKEAFNLLTETEKNKLVSIYNEDGAQMMGWELKRIAK